MEEIKSLVMAKDEFDIERHQEQQLLSNIPDNQVSDATITIFVLLPVFLSTCKVWTETLVAKMEFVYTENEKCEYRDKTNLVVVLEFRVGQLCQA